VSSQFGMPVLAVCNFSNVRAVGFVSLQMLNPYLDVCFLLQVQVQF